jgi:hypothetical protein
MRLYNNEDQIYTSHTTATKQACWLLLLLKFMVLASMKKNPMSTCRGKRLWQFSNASTFTPPVYHACITICELVTFLYVLTDWGKLNKTFFVFLALCCEKWCMERGIVSFTFFKFEKIAADITHVKAFNKTLLNALCFC